MNHKGRCKADVGVVHMKGRLVGADDQEPRHRAARGTTCFARTAMNGKMNGWNAVFGCNPPSNRRNCLTYYTPAQILISPLKQHFVSSDRTFSMFDARRGRPRVRRRRAAGQLHR
jgi:hypothetical protein